MHIEPGLGRLKLAKLTTPHVLAWLRAKNEEGTGAAVLKKAFGLLKRALAQAVAWNLIPRNPAEGVKPPCYSSPEISPLSLEDVPRFLEAIRGDPFEALFLIAATGGPRESEILALKWEDVAQDCSHVRIDEGVVVLPGVEHFDAPKSKAAKCSVPLTRMAATAPREHRRRFLEARMQTGGAAQAR